MQIHGGLNNVLANVTDDHQLETLAEALTLAEISARKATSYAYPLPVITLTDAAVAAVAYLQNDDASRNLQVSRILLSFAASDAPGIGLFTFYSGTGALGGTLVSAGTAFTPVQRNFGSTQPSPSTQKYGGTGSTLTGGTFLGNLHFKDGTTLIIPTEFVLPPGTQLAMTVQAPAGTTSMGLTAIAIGNFYTPEA